MSPAGVQGTLVDAHFHIWDTTALPYSWLRDTATHGYGQPSGLPRVFSFRDYLEKAAPMALAPVVHVEAAPDGGSEAIEIEHVIASTTGRDPHIRAIAGPLYPYSASSGFVVGRRLIVSQDPDPEWSFGAWDPEWVHTTLQRGVERAAAEQSVLDVQLYPHQCRSLLAVLARQDNPPRVVINHAGLPRLFKGAEGWKEWDFEIRRVAASPTVAIKLGGLRMVSSGWSPSSARRIVETAIDLFEPRRVMFGSNLPVDPVGHVAAFAETYRAAASELTTEQQSQMLRTNVDHWYAPAGRGTVHTA